MAYTNTDFVHDRAASHAHTVEALQAAHARLRDQVIPAVSAVIASLESSPWLLPLRGIISAKAEAVSRDLRSVEKTVADLMEYLHMPFWLWRDGEEWTRLRDELSSVVGDLGVTNREVHVLWHGAAADAYHTVLPAQVGAAEQLSSSADSIQYVVTWAGTTLAIFFATLLAILLQMIAGLLAALVTAAAVPLAVGGLVAAGLVIATAAGELAVLILATTDVKGRMKIWTNQILSQLRNNANFPNGEWPVARTEWYDDATVADGDADWSVVSR
jgi:hypothetical protein